jgi:hypothetical protein
MQNKRLDSHRRAEDTVFTSLVEVDGDTAVRLLCINQFTKRLS